MALFPQPIRFAIFPFAIKEGTMKRLLPLILLALIAIVWYGSTPQKEVSLQQNQDGSLQISGTFKGDSLRVTLPTGAFDSPPGSVFEYSPDDKIPLTHYAPNGEKRHGHYSISHDNGQQAIEGTYVQGLMSGPWTHYDSTGAKVRVEIYVAGKKRESIDCSKADCDQSLLE